MPQDMLELGADLRPAEEGVEAPVSVDHVMWAMAPGAEEDVDEEEELHTVRELLHVLNGDELPQELAEERRHLRVLRMLWRAARLLCVAGILMGAWAVVHAIASVLRPHVMGACGVRYVAGPLLAVAAGLSLLLVCARRHAATFVLAFAAVACAGASSGMLASLDDISALREECAARMDPRLWEACRDVRYLQCAAPGDVPCVCPTVAFDAGAEVDGAVLLEASRFAKVLVARGVGLSSIPSELFLAPVLYHLDVGANRGVSWVPTEVGHLKTLKHLDLSSASLRELPTEVAMASLRMLDVGSNDLPQLPSEIAAMDVVALVASQNRLSRLPEALGDAPSLEVLDVSVNHLEHLPEGLVDDQGRAPLRALFARDNRLSSINGSSPDARGKSSLEQLLVAGNDELHAVPSAFAQGWESLCILDARNTADSTAAWRDAVGNGRRNNIVVDDANYEACTQTLSLGQREPTWPLTVETMCKS